MLLYGAGGHAKVILSCLLAEGVKVHGIFDDNPFLVQSLAIPFVIQYDNNTFQHEPIIISIGHNPSRKRIAGIIQHTPGNVFHPSAIIDVRARVKDGTVVLHQCVIQADVTIGRHVIVNTGAIVEHDSVIGDFVHLAPGVVICGNVIVGENTLVGAGSVIAPNLIIGKDCLIAAGSVVTMNIPDGATVRGNPGRIVKMEK